MLDLLVSFAVVLVVGVAGVCFVLIVHLSRTRESVIRTIAGVRRDMEKVDIVIKDHSARMDRLDRGRSFSAEQEARVSAIENRLDMARVAASDRRKTDGQDF